MKKQGGFTHATLAHVRKKFNRYQGKMEGLFNAARHGRFRKITTAWLLALWPTVEVLTELAAACG